MTAVKLLIVDDHPVVRDGLRGVFAGDPDFDVVGEASDGREALAAVGRLDVDVVLMDLRMPGMGGVAAITELAVVAPTVRVLVLTTFDTDSDVLPAIEAGATGYLLKDAPRDELIRAVRAAARGDSVLSPAVARRLMDRVGPATGQPAPVPAPKIDTLSPRELEVLTLVSQGVTNRDAAKRLFLSEATVKTHLLHIYAKLGVNDRAAAVAVGYELGLLTPGRLSDS
ncbi:MAG TPA: response regulator transcription factor [Pseudonocardiaceae bacterium]|nr:response regulator transcription factor [Pseudonocardiaceae bacterium]